MASIEEYADQIMALIDSDIADGLIPAAAKSFSELHEYVDANDYGIEVVPFDGPDCTCERTLANPGCSCVYAEAWNDYMEYLNAIEWEVSKRLLARTAK